MPLEVEVEREDDGRWIAEIPAVPGALAYGISRDDAISKAESLALRAMADELDNGERSPQTAHVFAVTP